MIFTNIIINSDITLDTADVGIDVIIISVAQQRKPKSSPVRNCHTSSQTSSQLQSFCVLDSQRTAVKTSKLAPPKNFYLFMIFTNIIIRSDITLCTADVGIDVIIISVTQQRKPKSSPVRNSHRSSQTSSQLQNFCVLDSQRTAVKTSKLAPPKNFYLVVIFTKIIIRSDITLYTADVGIDVIIISVAQQRKPKSSPVRNSHRSSQTSSQLQNFCVLDSQRTAVKTSKLAPPKNFYLVVIFTNIIIRSDITLYTADVGIDVIIISVAQQRKPKSLPVRNSHRSLQTS